MERGPLRIGQQVRHRGTRRCMLVRGFEGDLVRCTWFDGRYCVQATVSPADLDPCNTGDERTCP